MYQHHVFPARAGMSPDLLVGVAGRLRVPRASGDEPRRDPCVQRQGSCSPRERG